MHFNSKEGRSFIASLFELLFLLKMDDIVSFKLLKLVKMIKLGLKRNVFFFVGLLLFTNTYAQPFNGIDSLINRRFPWMHGQIDLLQLPQSKAGEDAFKLYSKDGKLVIEASSASAAATGLNYYLKEVCHQQLTHGGDHLVPLKQLPQVKDTISRSTPFRYRYALNYCTYNYSFSFYNWEDWEREVDWMALNGVNLMLAQMGTEEVWQRVLAEFGYTDSEIKAFIPGPAFNAWWLMGNLEGWGGPVNDGQIKKWTSLQQRLLKRMKELGIKPVLQGFYGMVPSNLKVKYPTAKIIEQGTWAGGFQRPSILLPEDPLFTKMASSYYRELKTLYGTDILFLGGDLFHEGGNIQGLDIRAIAKGVQSSMQAHIPGSTWILQGWGNNPKKELLTGLNPQTTLIIDLFGESARNWERTKGYYGFPWIWASINNFGGKMGMGAQLPKLVHEPYEALHFAQGGPLQGVGIIPEGIRNNPVVYELALGTAWEGDGKPVENLLHRYLLSRYGTVDDELWQAWQLLLKSLYGNYQKSGQGGFESIFCARPNLNLTSASTWGPQEIQYDPKIPFEALKSFMKVADRYRKLPTFRYDLVDLARQVLADHARLVYQASIKAFNEKDEKKLAEMSSLFLQMLKQQDQLLNTHTDFMLGTWLKEAADYADGDPERVQLNLKNAKMQISIWGPDNNAATDLHDYAHKEWGGILRDFYLPRWEHFYANLSEQLKGEKTENIAYFEMEKAWVFNTKPYPVKAQGNPLKEVESVIQLLNTLLSKKNEN